MVAQRSQAVSAAGGWEEFVAAAAQREQLRGGGPHQAPVPGQAPRKPGGLAQFASDDVVRVHDQIAALGPGAAAPLASVPLGCLASLSSACSSSAGSTAPADAAAAPPLAHAASLGSSAVSSASSASGDAPRGTLTGTAAASALAASVAAASAVGCPAAPPGLAAHGSVLSLSSSACDVGSASLASLAAVQAVHGGGDLTGRLPRVDTVPLNGLERLADYRMHVVADSPDSESLFQSARSDSSCGASGCASPARRRRAAEGGAPPHSGGGSAAAVGVQQEGGEAAAAAAQQPAMSPSRARLIAQLQRRQRERELESAGGLACGGAACACGCGGAGPPPAEWLARAREGLVLVAGAAMVPHIAKAATGGEDAYFVSAAGHGSLAVSDGVSAWAGDGIDPGEYSRTLVANLRSLMEHTPPGCGRFEGRAVLRRAQMATLKPGSATVVLAALRPRPEGAGGGAGSGASGAWRRGAGGPGSVHRSSSYDDCGSERDQAPPPGAGGPGGPGGGGGPAFDLHVSNLGDCGVRVMRGGKVVFATKPQQHDFNLPFQLSHPRLFPETDTADSADRYVLEVQEGDVVVAASDGLFDNMWDDELLSILGAALDPSAALPPPPAPAGRHRRSGSFKNLFSRSHSANGAPAARKAPPPPPQLLAPAPSAPVAPGGGELPLKRFSRVPTFASLRRVRSEAFAAPPASAAEAAAAAAAPASLSSPASGASDDGTGSASGASSPPAAEPPSPRSPAARAGPLQLAQRAADALVAAAFRNARDDAYKSPWAAAARSQGLLARLFAHGGKMDDCTCVVAIVADAATAPHAPDAAGGPAP